jgi:hypothetical protein
MVQIKYKIWLKSQPYPLLSNGQYLFVSFARMVALQWTFRNPLKRARWILRAAIARCRISADGSPAPREEGLKAGYFSHRCNYFSHCCVFDRKHHIKIIPGFIP